MKNRIFTISLMVFLFMVLTKCDTDKNPLSYDDTNIIMNSSFEENGSPSLDHWTVYDSKIVCFDNDVPPGGGKWAVYFHAGWFPSVYTLSYFLPLTSGEYILNLSLWARYKSIRGSAFLMLKRDNIEKIIESIEIKDTEWTKYSVLDTLRINSGDSLFILLSAGGTEVADGETHFDLVEVNISNND